MTFSNKSIPAQVLDQIDQIEYVIDYFQNKILQISPPTVVGDLRREILVRYTEFCTTNLVLLSRVKLPSDIYNKIFGMRSSGILMKYSPRFETMEIDKEELISLIISNMTRGKQIISLIRESIVVLDTDKIILEKYVELYCLT